MSIIRLTLTCVCLLLLWSRATADSTHPQLPADATINKDAGRNGWLFVTLRLESGEELPFIVDTGTPATLLAKSLAPKLGKRLRTGTFYNFGHKQECGCYAAPELWLGSTPLMTGSQVWTYNFKWLSFLGHRHIMGILGMDCLQHYCIQLDFEARKMRFLDPDQVESADLGKAFPLTFSSEAQSEPELIRPLIHHIGLFGGTSANSLIDTGYNTDGQVEIGAIKGHYLTRFAHFFVRSRSLRLPECVWDGDTYMRLSVSQGEHGNILGLRFLARHLVTFNFPKGTMYLKRESAGPITEKN